MKKKVFISVFILLVILGVVSWSAYHQSQKENVDFYTFREYLDKEFFPVIHDISDYMVIVAEKNDEFNLGQWNIETGFKANLKLKSRLKEAREKIINKDVKYEDTLTLKKHILLYVLETEEILDNIYHLSPSAFNLDKIKEFADIQSTDMERLTGRMKEINDLLGKYYD